MTLASKCMEPGFRMHLRAHGTVTKFFAELRDAPENASLALCASTVLFVLSQVRKQETELYLLNLRCT